MAVEKEWAVNIPTRSVYFSKARYTNEPIQSPMCTGNCKLHTEEFSNTFTKQRKPNCADFYTWLTN